MTLGEAILNGNVRAVGALAERIRDASGTHQDVINHVQSIYRRAGREIPAPEQVDAWLGAYDEILASA